MRERPEILGDLWALYRVDFWEWITRPRVDVLEELFARLPHEPHSMWRAKEALGGAEWFGWDVNAAIAANTFDALQFNTSASATNKKAKAGKPHPRPQDKPKKKRLWRPPGLDGG